MNKTWLLIAGIALLGLGAIFMVNSHSTTPTVPAHDHHVAEAPVQPAATAAQTMPAHFDYAPSRSSLGPTLDPNKFIGLTREAYRAAREIPQTLAQLPCYCHCDRGMGHKSLHSCYEDEHASQCATCINEALLALKLEKEHKLTPAQIRDRIVQEFGQ
ncbi:MAG TPA: CYCXC family (seleno)protein [Pyrinomonadaceae bacterium]|jgi:hypothetical protein|nr:CYCXC family (seleno)protein [Pyrinomonadaceae bacterium]